MTRQDRPGRVADVVVGRELVGGAQQRPLGLGPRAVVYGLGVLWTSLKYRLWKWGLVKSRLFSQRPTLRLTPYYQEVINDHATQPV